jgi:hypothetical protein
MTDRCNACGERSDSLTAATVLDTSGGAFVEFCEECKSSIEANASLLENGVCVCCIRRRSPSRSEGIHFQTSEPPRHLCDECRKAIVFDNTGTFGKIPDIGGGWL